MRTLDEITPGQLLREARARRGVSQVRLAVRVGTTQSAISRIERDQVSPSFETVRGLLHMLGEDLLIGTRERDFGIDRTLNRANLTHSPAERVRRGLAFADTVRRIRDAA